MFLTEFHALLVDSFSVDTHGRSWKSRWTGRGRRGIMTPRMTVFVTIFQAP